MTFGPDPLVLDEEGEDRICPNSLTDLARVVAMLNHDQRELFDIAVVPSCSQRPSTTLMLDTKTILAAIVAATGVKA